MTIEGVAREGVAAPKEIRSAVAAAVNVDFEKIIRLAPSPVAYARDRIKTPTI